tara:strand:- start:403 stop:576 length:174 start_codon:yes stop_codon:yes gene_type:complete
MIDRNEKRKKKEMNKMNGTKFMNFVGMKEENEKEISGHERYVEKVYSDAVCVVCRGI